MDEKAFGRQLVLLRKERGLTQEGLAEALGVTAQAVSKWENGRSLPETALLPDLAALLQCSLDDLLSRRQLVILEAWYGDGLKAVDVTGRVSRLADDRGVALQVSDQLLGVVLPADRVPYLVVKYKGNKGSGYRVCREGQRLELTADSAPPQLPRQGIAIWQGSYGTREQYYDAMPKITHYRPFGWKEYRADDRTFPSHPANDGEEYLTLAYANSTGVYLATCREGESLALGEDGTSLLRKAQSRQVLLPGVPRLPMFGQGMECSWAAALTAALQAMGEKTCYDQVMGVSGACYRIAFCSPGWDFSSADGLVAQDYATPGYRAFGYEMEWIGQMGKEHRAGHRARIAGQISAGRPVLGIKTCVWPRSGVLSAVTARRERSCCAVPNTTGPLSTMTLLLWPAEFLLTGRA